jgi:O-succinylbenzoic acid--CoA ligase
VVNWLHLAARKHPDRIAVEGPERSLTYGELSDAAVVAARSLQGLGVTRRVALALPPGEDFVIALHACMLAGVAAVPVDLRLGDAERARRTAGAEVALAEPDAPASERGWMSLSGDRRLKVIHVGEGRAEAEGRGQPIAVMHTSGTTAAPKPVELSPDNFLASALGSAVALGLDPVERWLCPMPLTHVGGLSIPIRSAIYATTAVLHARFDTEAVLGELIDPARRITIVSLVPTMLARLLDAGLERPPELRWALLGGGPIPPRLLERADAAGVPVAPTYGMTEACSQIATFGWPLAGAEIHTSQGEVIVRGPMVSEGALAEDGWLHTGDLGHFDERSRLVITGRQSDTIVTGGENVSPGEVEAVLLAHPAIADAGVFGRPDPEWGEALVAAVVPRDGETVEAQALRDFCAEHLAGFKVPKAVELVERLPRTESGKLLRRQLTRLV